MLDDSFEIIKSQFDLKDSVKKCPKCLIFKDKLDFSYDKSKKDGLKSYCRICHNRWNKENRDPDYPRQYRIKNAESLKQKRKEKYKRLGKEMYQRRKIQLIANPEMKDRYRTKKRQYTKNKIKTDRVFAMGKSLRGRLAMALKQKNWRKTSGLTESVGCEISFLKIYIESQFTSDMCWMNYGTYWVIDHIIPLCSAKTVKDVIKLNHYTNLRPLSKKENSDKVKEDLKCR